MFSENQQKKRHNDILMTMSSYNDVTVCKNNARSNNTCNIKTANQQEKYSCIFCNYNTCKKSRYDAHIATVKHKSNMTCNEKTVTKKTSFICDLCDYYTDRRSNYNDHLVSDKHKRNCEPKSNDYFCSNCMRKYNSRSGLWRHQQKCEIDNKIDNKIEEIIENKHSSLSTLSTSSNNITITPELFMLLIQQNKEMQQIMVEQQNNYMKQQNIFMEKMIENGGNNHHNNNTINNDNKSFNLNFFLNETCKNAMNLSDFVNGVDISLDDFEETGRIGYVEGLSRVFCKELKKLHFTERPIHCSDLKRETIYIRENNRWEKDENKEKLLRAVKQIGKKNIKVLTLWQEKYPGYKDVESKENDRYLHILTNIMCGETEEEIQSNYGKIMKNISRITVVEKK
jgi:hypothetical protein